jgi:Glycosyltransferase family 87
VTGVTVLNTDPGELVSGRAARTRPRHRLLQGQASPRHAGGLGRAPAVAMVVHIWAAFALMPVAGHPYDLAALSGTSGAWLRWGIPLFYHWKFGFDLSILAVGSQSLSFVLEHLGMSGAAALAVAWKLPLVLADLLVGTILVDLGRQLRCQRPALMATLWLISPVPLWVSAGHGQIESLTILAVVLSLDLLLRRRPLLAGVVAGLGIGVEYLPALVAIVVIFWLHVSVVERREAYRFFAGCAVALAFGFGPLLSTSIGRTSLLAGLSFSAAAASHPGHVQAASRMGSSLWAVFNLSPGPFWLAAALSMSLGLMIVLAHKARNANSIIDRRRLGILAAGGLLLCVSLFDPGALPQFSVLVIGGLCIVGLCVNLSPAVIVLGPFLQLAAGLVFVYGGSFQSYWYDMWARTGASGWPFPQSLLAAYWAARLGVLVIALGLLSASSHVFGGKVPAGLRTIVARSSIAVAVIGSAFLATWSLQPAFWQGVGSQGPSTLADFPLITAFQPGTVSMGPDHQMITFSPQEVLAARESTVPPSLKLTVTARPFFAQTTADAARSGHGAVQALTIPGWLHKKTQVHSLWVSALLGRPVWRSQADVLGRVPALAVEGHRFDASVLRRRHRGGHQLRSRRHSRPPATRRLIISSGEATWVAPGWAVVTYAVPASMVSSRGRLALGLRGNDHGADVIAWNGSPHARWVLISLRSGRATVTIDGKRWRDLVTLPRPPPSLWYRHVEETSIQGVPLAPDAGVSITGVAIGGTRGAIVDGGLAWPTPGVLDHTIDGPLLSALGIVDVITLLGGALVLSRWAAGTRMPRVRFRGNPQKQASREADTESRARPTQYSPPAEAAE